MSRKCRKKRFDRLGAMLALAEAQRRPQRGETRIYYCDRCRAWHLTSQARRQK